MADSDFQRVEAAYSQSGVAGALDALIACFRDQKRYHELFEALKMQVRQRLGLPLLYGDSGDALNDELRNKLEDGLIEACREVGNLLLAAGHVRDGWMYLRPVGDKRAAAELIAKIEPDEDNMEELVDVCLREGVDVARGFQLVLDNYGTCNAITTFEGEMPRHTRADQKIAASQLLRHLYKELLANLRTDIGRQEGQQPAETTLKALVADRPWLFQELTYHVDTTHLAAVVRFARLLDDRELLALALDLTEYGRRLHSQFQYPGDEPFTDNYPAHAKYFQVLLGQDLDESLAYFREKAQTCDPRHVGTAPIEIYVDLLSRTGRAGEAIEESIRLMPEGLSSQGLAPSLLDLAQQSGQYDRVVDHCRGRADLLGFTAALVRARRAPMG